ncbi:MAG: ester cyclase [Saprospirales bacterium]|nr:ester cyclase [Saprospirales bacterium]
MKKSFFFAALLALTLNQAAAQGKHETTIREFFAAVDAGNFEKVGAYLHSDLQVYMPLSPEPLNLEAYRNLGMGFKIAFPDIEHKILECAETGNAIGFKAWFSGTNTGPMMGNPPTGNRVSMPFIGFFKFDDAGKIVEINSQFDLAAFNAQLGGMAADSAKH